MSAETSLIHIDYTVRTAKATEAAVVLKEQALSVAALIGKVTNESEQTEAVRAQAELKRVIKLVDKAEELAKAPLNEVRGSIIQAAKQFKADLDTEGLRIQGLVGDFQEKERARVLAEQRLAQQEIDKLERARLEAIAKAPTIEAQDKINEAHCRAVAEEVRAPIAPIRAAGQIVRHEWNITVSDIWTLARAHPGCVKIEPRLSEIKSLLEAGVKVAGVLAVKQTISGVRAAPQRAALEA